jgi:D-3-phosphoglycerate dehydrogenase
MSAVLFTIGIEEYGEPRALARLEQAGLELRRVRLSPSTSPAEVVALLDGVVATLAGGEPYNDQVFGAAPRLRHVARLGVGYDAVDLAAASRHAVAITTTQGANDAAVADHAFGLVMALAHNIVRYDRSVRRGEWRGVRGSDVWRKTLGIVGLGRIGKRMARRAQGFEMRVLASEPAPDMEFVRQYGVELVSLEELLRESDVVTLHLPLSAETRGFMGPAEFARMKPGAYFVNTARGGLVDEDALHDALASGHLGGAGLDVRIVEPNRDGRFVEFENVVLTPHTAASTAETWEAMSAMAVDTILQLRRGERPHGLLNPEAWNSIRARIADG